MINLNFSLLHEAEKLNNWSIKRHKKRNIPCLHFVLYYIYDKAPDKREFLVIIRDLFVNSG